MDRLRHSVLASISSDDPTATLEKAQMVRQLAIELCHSYPGDLSVPSPISTPDRPFTLMLDDFRLVNVLIDEDTGRVNGYIDFEGTTVVPLWQSATVPDWIPDPDSDMANWYGGTPEEQRALWLAFHPTIDQHDNALTGGEWRKAYELGEPFRNFADRFGLGISFWAEHMEAWLKKRLEWSKAHPGVGLLEVY
ncbi:hypothetical protein BDV93DRAFT_457968 [Ceratobasidium sp. AG-I]|nr:hypothetical protein BDV93DRAFT_457968 [Ceratobasidium sp. AG-I]